jgi:hypothetical protein
MWGQGEGSQEARVAVVGKFNLHVERPIPGRKLAIKKIQSGL